MSRRDGCRNRADPLQPTLAETPDPPYMPLMLDDADDIHPLFYGAPKSTEFKKLRKRIVQNVREAIEHYGMVGRDSAKTPKWLVCLSGGKDSYTLLAVLGHHRDDILETFFMNLFHGGRLATMPPKLVNEEGDLFGFRPLAHVAEADCEKFAKAMNYPIIPCDLCGSQDGLQRQQVKAILDGWEKNSPGRRQVIFRALTNARPSHLLDSELFDFKGLSTRLGEESDNPLDIPKLR